MATSEAGGSAETKTRKPWTKHTRRIRKRRFVDHTHMHIQYIHICTYVYIRTLYCLLMYVHSSIVHEDVGIE